MTATKRKRVSKKSKESWRKHVNIKDVEKYLENKRNEENAGKLAGNELFVIDKLPSGKLTKKEKRALLIHTPPKCFPNLKPDVDIPELEVKRKRVTPAVQKKKKLEEQQNKKILQRIKRNKEITEKRISKERKAKEEKEVQKDLWEVDDNPKKILTNEWFEETTIRHNINGLGKMQKQPPKSYGKRTSVYSNVEIPHPGMSYNPSFKDHQSLLNEVAEKEMKIIKEQKHLDRVTSQMFRKISPQKAEKNWIIEMSEGLKPAKRSEEPDDSDGEFKSVNPPVKNKKKDERQKRKKQLHLKLEEERRRAKLEKKKIADIYKLRQLKEDIEKRDKLLKIQQAKREKAKKKKQTQTKRLGAKKFDEPDLEFNAPEELPGNLRNIKMEGHILKDRFTSLQKRNIIPPSAKRLKKRAKVKKVLRSSCKVVGVKFKKNKYTF